MALAQQSAFPYRGKVSAVGLEPGVAFMQTPAPVVCERPARACQRGSFAISCPWSWLLAVLLSLATACGEDTQQGGSGAGAGSGATDSDLGAGGSDVDEADTQEADAPAADIDQPDVGPTDIAAPDISVDADTSGSGTCPGGANCPCGKDSECDTGVCLETSAGKQCAKGCSDGNCPSGSACKLFGTTDQIAVCVPLHLTICAPCAKNADCQVQGANDAWCLDRGADGAYCGGICTKDGDCPDGFQCAEGKPIAGGAAVKACQPKGAAACSCSAWAIKAGVATNCQTSNNFGTCGGKRSCSQDGMTACDAPAAKPETCNNLDDNCNGKVDDLNVGAACLKKAFDSKGSGQACVADGDCPQGEACNAGKCKVLIGACPGKATCSTSGEEICLDAKTPLPETCNGQDDDCDSLTDETFGWVDLAGGASIAIGQPCGAGLCAGGVVQCQTLSQATCSTAGKAAKDGCNGQDDDCDGQTDESACEDNNPCTTDTCNAVKAACEHSSSVDCDDKNPCTTDSCDKANGGCQHALMAGASCADGNACTIGDSCGKADDGTSACLPGATAAKCEDGNLCTDDSCDPSKGCVALPNAATQVCYEGPSGTAGKGICHNGKKVCKDGQLGGCEDQVQPATKEGCDGMDDDCDGLTDETCTGDQWQGSLVAVSGSGLALGSSTVVGVSAGGSSPVGELLSATATSLWAGFARWMLGW